MAVVPRRSGARAGGVLFALLAALALLAGGASAKKGNVIVIDGEASLDAALAANDFLVVEYFAPWCGHCKKLEPEYAKAADTLKAAGAKIALAACDATKDKNKVLSERAAVKGFPTLKIYRGGSTANAQDYNGPREADGIVSYLMKQAGPAASVLEGADEVDALVAKDSVVVVGVFPKGDEASEAAEKVFLATASLLRDDFTFTYTADAALLPQGGAAGASGPFVAMFKNYDAPRTAAPAEALADVDALKEWAAKTATPLVGRLDADPKQRALLKRVFESQLPKLLAFGAFTGADAAVEAAMRAAAPTHPRLHFIVGEAGENSGALGYFGLSAEDTPALVIHDAANGDKKYTKVQATPDDVAAFIGDFEAGKLVAAVKSEAVPEDNSGPVTVLVAKNFEDIVGPANAKGKTILLEFYAPWCGHCKSLAPVYDKLGAAFAGRDDVVIAKMDATANDVPDERFPVKGFPTLFLQTAEGEVVPYSGDRTLEALTSFVEKHAGGKAAAAEVKDEL